MFSVHWPPILMADACAADGQWAPRFKKSLISWVGCGKEEEQPLATVFRLYGRFPRQHLLGCRPEAFCPGKAKLLASSVLQKRMRHH